MLPDEPLSELVEGAVNQHEMYMAWIEAGFTENQSLELLKAVLTSLIRGVTD